MRSSPPTRCTASARPRRLFVIAAATTSSPGRPTSPPAQTGEVPALKGHSTVVDDPRTWPRSRRDPHVEGDRTGRGHRIPRRRPSAAADPHRAPHRQTHPRNRLRHHQSDADASPEQIAAWLRGHWSIENRLHWTRDATYDLDRSQIRAGQASQVMASLRNTAIRLLRLAGHTNIAAGCRHHARDFHRPVELLITC